MNNNFDELYKYEDFRVLPNIVDSSEPNHVKLKKQGTFSNESLPYQTKDFKAYEYNMNYYNINHSTNSYSSHEQYIPNSVSLHNNTRHNSIPRSNGVVEEKKMIGLIVRVIKIPPKPVVIKRKVARRCLITSPSYTKR